MTQNQQLENQPNARFPFLFGAQYYRAPTPEPECWEKDLAHMHDLGFNAVKYWVQWRWSHRAPEEYFYSDLDRLMTLADQYHLGVTLNVIFDVTPTWLYQEYPDAKQVNIQGQAIQPFAVGHRQIGGHPGPCYNHPEAKIHRKRFFENTIHHFRNFPALQMWDVWNEPELCFPSRRPDLETMVCYCSHCKVGFRNWLEKKYKSLDHLNQVWGRCYRFWEEVEMPRGTGTVGDFIDWREFHLDTLATEAQWRLEMVKTLDPVHGSYLHIVPNTWFSAVSAADDFAMAEHCEAFGGTMIGNKPASGMHVTSAAQGRICYNAESHINFGSLNLHQREVNFDLLCKEFLPQIGMGVKGFLFWQYRPEVLGVESPAWGLVNLDGSDRAATAAAREFWSKLRPYAAKILKTKKEKTSIALWRSRKNEIFHFCMRGEVDTFNQGLEAWIDGLYSRNLPFQIINEQMLSQEKLEGIKLLILPMPYYLIESEVESIKKWVKEGGCLLTEAHLAAYDGTRGRHNRVIPGGGLAEKFGFSEKFSSAVRHFSSLNSDSKTSRSLPPDVQKALREQGEEASDLFALSLKNGKTILGAQRYAELMGKTFHPLGGRPNRMPCIIYQQVDNGHVIYAGTNLGEAAAKDAGGLHELLEQAIQAAGISSLTTTSPVSLKAHCDVLFVEDQPAFLMINNLSKQPVEMCIDVGGRWKGIYSEGILNLSTKHSVNIPGDWIDLLIRVDD